MTRRQAIALGALQVAITTAIVGLYIGNERWWLAFFYGFPSGALLGWLMWELFAPFLKRGVRDDDVPPLQ